MGTSVEFAVLGAGALGSILGAHLRRAGHEVLMLARGQRAREIERRGLRIRGLVDIDVPAPVLDDPRRLRDCRVLIVATKARGTAESLEPLKNGRVECAFSIQNGILKNELLAAAFGRERVLGALANTSGELLESGEVLFTRNVNLLIGEPDGAPSERVQRLAHAIDAAGVRAAASDDIESQEWCKFAGWVGFMALAVTTRANTWKYLIDPGCALLVVRLVREIGLLARACGVALSDDSMLPIASLCDGPEERGVAIVTAMGAQFRADAPAHRTSTLQDLEAGRPLELEETVGHAVRLGAQRGLALPLLEGFLQLLGGIDRMRAL